MWLPVAVPVARQRRVPGDLLYSWPRSLRMCAHFVQDELIFWRRVHARLGFANRANKWQFNPCSPASALGSKPSIAQSVRTAERHFGV
jgi:hypothetical protein